MSLDALNRPTLPTHPRTINFLQKILFLEYSTYKTWEQIHKVMDNQPQKSYWKKLTWICGLYYYIGGGDSREND